MEIKHMAWLMSDKFSTTEMYPYPMRSVSKMLTECPGWVRVGGEEGQTHLVIYLFIKYVLSDFFISQRLL